MSASSLPSKMFDFILNERVSFFLCFCDLLFCVKSMQGQDNVYRHQSPVQLPCNMIFLIKHGCNILIQPCLYNLSLYVSFNLIPVSDYTAAYISYTGGDQAYITSESVLILNNIRPSGRWAGLEGPGNRVYQSTYNHVRPSPENRTLHIDFWCQETIPRAASGQHVLRWLDTFWTRSLNGFFRDVTLC